MPSSAICCSTLALSHMKSPHLKMAFWPPLVIVVIMWSSKACECSDKLVICVTSIQRMLFAHKTQISFFFSCFHASIWYEYDDPLYICDTRCGHMIIPYNIYNIHIWSVYIYIYMSIYIYCTPNIPSVNFHRCCWRFRKTEALAELSIAFNLLEPRPLRRIARALSSCAPSPGESGWICG